MYARQHSPAAAVKHTVVRRGLLVIMLAEDRSRSMCYARIASLPSSSLDKQLYSLHLVVIDLNTGGLNGEHAWHLSVG